MKKSRICATSLLAVLGFLCMDSRAETPTQTVSGAQKFLSQVVDNGVAEVELTFGKVKSPASIKTFQLTRDPKLIGSTRDSEHMELNVVVRARKISPVSDSESSNECVTKFVDLDFKDYQRGVEISRDKGSDAIYYTYKFDRPLSVILEPPQSADWGEVMKIDRNSSKIVAIFSSEKYGTFSVTVDTDDVGMLDRIEYAMNFLKLSCDSAANTGF